MMSPGEGWSNLTNVKFICSHVSIVFVFIQVGISRIYRRFPLYRTTKLGLSSSWYAAHQDDACCDSPDFLFQLCFGVQGRTKLVGLTAPLSLGVCRTARTNLKWCRWSQSKPKCRVKEHDYNPVWTANKSVNSKSRQVRTLLFFFTSPLSIH